jgi:5-methylcytosine-specific restriction endonuclease McrA
LRKKQKMYRCFYCDKILSSRKKTRDHVIPKSRNGSSARHNIVDACRDCNQLKGMLTLEEFRCVMAYRFGIIGRPKFRFPGELRRKP